LDRSTSITDKRAEKIYAFNVSTFRDFADFERVLPGVDKVYQTPLVGLWINGVLEVKPTAIVDNPWCTPISSTSPEIPSDLMS